jgi:hypothetical protein
VDHPLHPLTPSPLGSPSLGHFQSLFYYHCQPKY